MTSDNDNDQTAEKSGTETAGPADAASAQQAAAQSAPPSSATPSPPPKPEPEPRRSFWRFWRRRPRTREEEQARKRRARTRRRRQRGSLSLLSDGFSFLLVALVAGIFGLVSIRHVLNEPGPLRADKVVYFPPRTDALEMISQLEREGVVQNTFLMNATLLVENKIGKVKPGEYLFKQAASLREVIDELVNGRQVLHSVTIPEGLTSEQITQRLRDNDILSGEIMETPKEGALLPETYKVTRGFQRAKLVAKMQDDLKKLVDQVWAHRRPDLPIRTPFELVTLASIVEKETGKAEERPMVAAVYVNRLRKKMRLQSDPTIIYGLVGGKATLGRPILRSEIEKYTPYNTYAIEGLPPGPIANPGRASLEAAANPARTNDLYFVADGTGGHVFSQTLEQHNRNVQHWRDIEHERAAPPEAERAAPSLMQPPPTPDVKEKHGDAGPFGRLVPVSEGAADDTRSHSLNPSAGAASEGSRERRVFDASQGTRLDPLLDKSWDLNSPKTVPSDVSLR